jgi:hypothetical protein
MAVTAEERVTNLEQIMAQLTQNVDRLSREMRDFKDEMRDFKDEMRDFKDEMRDFKDEMRDFKTESRKQWGELANKLGTMAEDLVAPSIPRIVSTVVDCPADQINSAVRVRRTIAAGQVREFDVIATCGDYLFVNETKSRLTPEDIKEFVQGTLPIVRDFFPEYTDKQIIGIIASLYVDESLVRYGERQGLVVLGFGEDVMDVLNSPGFRPKTW